MLTYILAVAIEEDDFTDGPEVAPTTQQVTVSWCVAASDYH